MKKKLIIFMPFIQYGGVEKNLFLISNYLSKSVNNIFLITSNTTLKKKINKRIKIINPKIFNNNKNKLTSYFLCLIILIKILIKEKNYLVFSFQANIYCALICVLLNVNIIIRSNTSPIGWSHSSLKKRIYKIIISKVDNIILNSKEFKKQFKELLNLKSVCIYNPLDIKKIKKKSREKLIFPFFNTNRKTIKILTVGRLTEQKDHLTILKACNKLLGKINFKLLIIGSGEKKLELLNFIKENKLSDKVKIIDFKNNVYKYIKNSDLVILSSKYEGLPNILLESIYLNKPIISTNCPTGPKEILLNGKGGELFKIHNHNQLAYKIYKFYKNPSKLNHKKKIAFKHLNRFDYKKNLEKYKKIIFSYL